MGFALVGILLVLLALSIPIGVALGLAAGAVTQLMGLPAVVIPQRLFVSNNSELLLAIPFFMLAGEVMNAGGLSLRLTELAKVAVGYLPGGLVQVATLSCVFFAGISGSGAADTAAVSTVMIPEMRRSQYPDAWSGSVIASAGALGILIPPSIPMVVYGVVADVSIGRLFLYGILPGLLIALSIFALNHHYARAFRLPTTPFAGWAAGWLALRRAWLALLMPVIIVGGIYGGVFTPTEAAAVAAGYAVLVTVAVHRTLTLQQLYRSFVRAGIQSAVVMLVINGAAFLEWVIAYIRLPQVLTAGLTGLTANPYLLLLIFNLVLLLVGCFLNPAAAITILAPILVPAAAAVGVDPLFFGLIMIVNLVIGEITPPVGLDLFVISGIGKIKIERLSRAIVPYVVLLVADLMLITYVPLFLGFGWIRP